MIVRPREVKGRQAQRIYRVRTRQGIQVLEDILLDPQPPRCSRPPVFLRLLDIPLQLLTQPTPQRGQRFAQHPGREHDAGDVPDSPAEPREPQSVVLHLDHIAIFLAQRAVAQEGRDAQVEEFAEVGCRVGVFVCEACAE